MSEPIRVEGADETAAALRQLGDNIANDVEPAGKVAQLGVSEARNKAPFITGELASGYMVRDRFIENDVPYAQFVEYGTRYMDAQYIVQRALETIEGQAGEIYTEWTLQKASEVGFETTG